MCDVEKYRNMYRDMKQLTPDDTLEIILNTDDPVEQDFFEMLGDFLLQKSQEKVIKANEF